MAFRGRKRKKRGNSLPPNKKKKIVEKTSPPSTEIPSPKAETPSPSSTQSLRITRSKSSGRGKQISTEITVVDNGVQGKSKNEPSQPHSDLKVTKDSNKTIEEKQIEIQKMLTFPGHSFILVLSDKIDEDTKAYDCVLCFQNLYRTGLQEMVQHCKSKEHLLKVMELVNPNYEIGNSEIGTNEIETLLKNRTSNLDEDGVLFTTPSTFLSLRKKIFKRIVALRKEQKDIPIKVTEDLRDTKSNSVSSAKIEHNIACSAGVKDSSSKEETIPQITSKTENSYCDKISAQNSAKKICNSSEEIKSEPSTSNSKTVLKIAIAEHEVDKSSIIKEGKIKKVVLGEDKIKVPTAAKSESNKSKETKEGKRKIEKIVWDEDKTIAEKSESDKSTETSEGIRKIKKIVWDEDKTAGKSELDKLGKALLRETVEKLKAEKMDSEEGIENAEEIGREKSIQKDEEFLWDEDSNVGTFDIQKLTKAEKKIYETYQYEISELVELQKNRRPSKVIIVTDGRDVFTEEVVCTGSNRYRIIKEVNLTTRNLDKYLVKDPDFGSGVLFVILCGINSLTREEIYPACLKFGCASPLKYLTKTSPHLNLIKKALNFHKLILMLTKNDMVIFSGLIPSSPEVFNDISYNQRKCSKIHEAKRPKRSTNGCNNEKLQSYNAFIKLHSKLLGFPPLNLEDLYFSDHQAKQRALQYGYKFKEKFAYKRRLTILKKCDILMKRLKQSPKNLQDKVELINLEDDEKEYSRIDYPSEPEETAVAQASFKSTNEFVDQERKMKHRLSSGTVTQPSNVLERTAKKTNYENRRSNLDEDGVSFTTPSTFLSGETKEGKRKIERIVWDEDQISAEKPESEKVTNTSEEIREINKIVWDGDKTIAADKYELDKLGKSVLKKTTRKRKAEQMASEEGIQSAEEIAWEKIKQNVEEVPCNEDYSIDTTFDIRNLRDFEKKIYETYKNEINELVELQRNRRPNKVILVTDERDVFTEDEISTENYQFRIIKDVNLNLLDLKENLVQDPDFGTGVLFVILCGINSINREKINPACLKFGCASPSIYLGEYRKINLIRKALNFHKLLFECTKNDTAIFAGLIPSSPKKFNNVSYYQRKCSRIHEADPPPQCNRVFSNSVLYLYNTFAKLHSKLLGFFPLNLEFVYFKNHQVKLKALKNGYNFSDEFAFKRKLAILKKCDELMKKLSPSKKFLQGKEKLINLENDEECLRVGYPSESEGAAVPQAAFKSRNECVDQERKTKHRLSSETVTQPSKVLERTMKKTYQESKYQQVQAVISESDTVNERISRYDKIFVLGNSSYEYYLKQLRGPKVRVISEDISIDNLVHYIKQSEPLFRDDQSTLWVLVTGIEFLFSKGVHEICSDLGCFPLLQITQPSYKVASIYEATNTFDEMKEALNFIEKKVKSVLNFKSDFMLFPPIPPAMIIDFSVTHTDLHELMMQHPRSYVVDTNETANYFSNIYEKASWNFARFTRLALKRMGLSTDPLDNYLSSQLNQIDFIYSGVTSPENELPFFRKWLGTFRDIVSSSLSNSSVFETVRKPKKIVTSRKTTFNDDENEELDTDGVTVLYESEKNRHQYEKIDPLAANICQNKKVITKKGDRITQSGTECKSSTVTAVNNVSPQIKEKTTVSEKKMYEKSGKDPILASTERVKQSCKSNKKKQECDIYELASDHRPLPFLEFLASDDKSESFTPQTLDVDEEFSDGELCDEIFNDLDDEISDENPSEDEKELHPKSGEEDLSSDLSLHITTEIESIHSEEKKSQSVNVEDNKLKQKVPNHSLQNDTDNSPLGSGVVDKNEPHTAGQKLSEETDKATKQSLQIEPNNSVADSKEKDRNDLQIHETSKDNKVNKEMDHEGTSVCNKQTTSYNKLKVIQSTVHPQTSIAETDDDSFGEKRKLDKTDTISQDGCNKKFTKTLTKQSLVNRNQNDAEFLSIIFIANDHINSYLRTLKQIKVKDYYFWNVDFPVNWDLLKIRISSLSPTQTYCFVIITDITLMTNNLPVEECSSRSCNTSLVIHHLKNNSKTLLRERLMDIRTLHGRLKHIPNINTKVIFAPCFPRKCVDIQSIIDSEPHELLHKVTLNKFKPCLLGGDYSYINKIAIEFKKRWFDFVQDLNCSKDIELKKYVDVFFDLPYYYNSLNWTSISELDFPFIPRKLWTEKLILVYYHIESFLKVLKSSFIIEVSEESDMFLKSTKASTQIETNHSAFDSLELSLSEHQSVSDSLPEQSKMFSLELPYSSLQKNDTENSILVSEVVDRNQHYTVGQKSSEKTDKITKQILQTDPYKSVVDSEDIKDLKINMASEDDKVNKEMSLECTSTNDKNTTSGAEPGVIQTQIHPQTSVDETDDDSLPNWSSTSNQNNEKFEAENIESDYEELLIREELEREILEADDDGFEEELDYESDSAEENNLLNDENGSLLDEVVKDPASENVSVVENESLNEGNSSELGVLVTVNKRADLAIISEDLKKEESAEESKISEVINITNFKDNDVNLTENANKIEIELIDRIEPKESEEKANECAVNIDNTEDLNDKQNANENKTSQVIGNTNNVNVFEVIDSSESDEKENGQTAIVESNVCLNNEQDADIHRSKTVEIIDDSSSINVMVETVQSKESEINDKESAIVIEGTTNEGPSKLDSTNCVAVNVEENNDFLEKCSSEDKFSDKIVTNIPANEEQCNDEVKGQNEVLNHCINDYEKVGETEKSVESVTIKDTNSILQNLETEGSEITQSLKLKESGPKNKLHDPNITELQLTLSENIEVCLTSQHIESNCKENNPNSKLQNLNTAEPLPMLIKTSDDVISQPQTVKDKKPCEKNQDDAFSNDSSEDLECISLYDENLDENDDVALLNVSSEEMGWESPYEEDLEENENVLPSIVEVIQNDSSLSNNNVILKKSLETSGNILPLGEESKKDIYKSRKMEENSVISCDGSDVREEIQKQLLIGKELEPETLDRDDENRTSTRDALEDNIENLSKSLDSSETTELRKNNMQTSEPVCLSPPRKERLHTNDSDIPIECLQHNVTEVSLEVNRVSPDKESEWNLSFGKNAKNFNLIKHKLVESVDNSGETVEILESSKENSKEEMPKLTIDHIEVPNDPKVIKLIPDDQKNNEDNFTVHVNRDEKLIKRKTFQTDEEEFDGQLNDGDSVAEDKKNIDTELANPDGNCKRKMQDDSVNNASEEFSCFSTTTVDPQELNETANVQKDLESPTNSFESSLNNDSFSYPKKSELLGSDSYKQILTSVDETDSHLTNSSQVSSNILESESSNINTLAHPTYSNVESDGNDIETEGVMHKINLILSTDHSSEIETESDQKIGESHEMVTKSVVDESTKTESDLESSQTADKLNEIISESLEIDSSKSEVLTSGEKKETCYKVKKIKEKEMEVINPVPNVLSDSEDKDSNNTNSENKLTLAELNKVENLIPDEDIIHQFDHIYIIGRFNPVSEEKRKLLNFTFIDKSVSDLNEEDVINILDEKGNIVPNSVCIFVCDVLDILTKKSQEQAIIEYELKQLSYDPTEFGKSNDPIEVGKWVISKSIISFMKIIFRLRNKLPVVAMPLQPYWLTPQYKFVKNQTGVNDSILFLRGSKILEWIQYRDHFVNEWSKILDTNNEYINRSYIDSFFRKPSYVYPVTEFEMKDISIERRRLDWATKVNAIIFKLFKEESKKLKKSSISVKKEEHNSARSSKDKLNEPEKCKIKVTNLSESVPDKFFDEMSKKAEKEARCKFKEDYVEITFDSHLNGHLFADYLDNLAIGDTVLKTSFLHRDCKNDTKKFDETTRKNFRDSLQFHFEFWEFSASERARKNIKHTLGCESFKTIKCEKSDCDISKCIFYHTEADRRRNPFSILYQPKLCRLVIDGGTCSFGENCEYAHNFFECKFHPMQIYSNMCPAYKTREQCFSDNPLCPHAHHVSPETFFSINWIKSLLFGTPLAVEFLAGAIDKFSIYKHRCKADTKIFMMGASDTFLHNVEKLVNDLCSTRSLKHNFVGDNVFENEQLLFGKPSKFLERAPNLVLFPFTLVIVSQVDVLLSIKKERKALRELFSRSEKPFSPFQLEILFVADEYDSDLSSIIKNYLFKTVEAMKFPGHKVKFEHDVPCTPFVTQSLPKWLSKNSHPTQMHSFQSVLEVNKQKAANAPQRSREKYYSSDSEFSDDDTISEEGKRRSNGRGRKRRTTRSSPNRSPSPHHKRHRSKSPHRRRSTSRCSPPSEDKSQEKDKIEKTRKEIHHRSPSPHHKRNRSRSPQRRLSSSRGSPPSGDKSQERNKIEQTEKEISMDRIIHRSILLESVIQSFNTTFLRDEFGDDLYKEFEQEMEKTCFEIEEQFFVYKTKPELYEKYEVCYESFLQMYRSKYTCHSRLNPLRASLWKEFWKSNFDCIEKTELHNRVTKLIGIFREKIKFAPPPPLPPDLSGMAQRSHVSAADHAHPDNLRNMQSSNLAMNYMLPSPNAQGSSRFSNTLASPMPVPPPNAQGTSRLSNTQPSPMPVPPPNALTTMSNLVQQFLEGHMDNPVGGKMAVHQTSNPPPPPPPPPIAYNFSSQTTFNKSCHSSEASGIQTHSFLSSSNRDSNAKLLEENLGSRFKNVNPPSFPKSDNKTVSGVDQQQTLMRSLLEKLLPPSDFEKVDNIVGKSSSVTGKGSSSKSSERETPPIKKSHSLSSGITVLDKAIADLELMVTELGVLGTSINAILSVSKEEGINSEKSLRNFADPDNVSLMEFALTKMKAKCKEDRKDFYSSLERSVNSLIEYAKEELEKRGKKEEELEKRGKKELPPLDYEAIAKATIGKDASAILKMIRAAALYESVKLTKEQENESYMKICSMHFNLAAK